MFSRIPSHIKPYVAEGARTAVIMSIGDLLAQTVVEKKEFKDIDYVRTIKFGSLGLLFVGPVLKYWYGFLDRNITVNQGRWPRAIKKMVADQSIMAPALNLCITGLIGVINNESKDQIKNRIKYQYPEIIKNNYKLWPAVQMINFGIVPLNYQVVFVQLVAVVWNCFLSKVLNKGKE